MTAYKSLLDIKLDNMVLPFSAQHASQMTIKCKTKGRVNIIPGWNDMVKDLRHKAVFWHNIWKSSGCPKTGVIANIRRSTHCKYHYSIKDV